MSHVFILGSSPTLLTTSFPKIALPCNSLAAFAQACLSWSQTREGSEHHHVPSPEDTLMELTEGSLTTNMVPPPPIQIGELAFDSLWGDRKGLIWFPEPSQRHLWRGDSVRVAYRHCYEKKKKLSREPKCCISSTIQESAVSYWIKFCKVWPLHEHPKLMGFAERRPLTGEGLNRQGALLDSGHCGSSGCWEKFWILASLVDRSLRGTQSGKHTRQHPWVVPAEDVRERDLETTLSP